MASRTISTKMAITGQSEYQASITNINNSLKTLRSETAMLDAQYQGHANSLAALTAKGDVLARTYEVQKTKVHESTAALENAKKAQQEYSTQVDQCSAKLAGAQAKLEELKKSTSDTSALQAKLNAEVEKHQKALSAAEAGLQAATRGVNEWQQKLNYAQRDLANLDTEVTRNSKYLDEARSSATGCASSIDAFGKQIQTAGSVMDTAFQNAIININTSLETLKSELALVESRYQGSANSMDALAAKGEVLARTYEVQKAKVQESNAALENARQIQQTYSAQIDQCNSRLAAAKTQLEALKQTTGDTTAQQAALTTGIQQQERALETAQAKLQTAERIVSAWQQQVNYAEQGLNRLDAELANNKRYLEEAANSADKCAGSIDGFGRQVQESGDAVQVLVGALAAAGVAKGVQEISDALTDCKDASVIFESTMAGVRRTVGGGDAEIAAFGDTFKKLSTDIPITTTELGKIAETAGQLGIASGNVEAFTTVMSKLGTTTDLTADGAATMLAQFANITGTQDYERLGSTVAELGDATATTASKVVEMSQGMAASASLAGMSERNILAISAAVGSLGIEAQAGSTALSTLISTMDKSVETGGDKLALFASVANQSAAEFSAAWEEDAAQALNAFIQGLNDVERNGKSANIILDELGITNVRQTKAVLGLANAGDLLSNTLAQADQAWEENTALAEKAGIMYETTEAKVKMAENAFNNLKIAIGDALTPALGALAEAGTGAFSWAADFVSAHPELVQALTAVVTTLGSLAAGFTGLAVASMAIKAVQTAIAALTASTSALAAVSVPLVGVVAALVGFGTAITLAAGSMEDATTKARDLASGIEAARSAYEETTAAIQAQNDDVVAMAATLEELVGAEEQTAAQKQTILELVDRLNEAIPELNLQYDAQKNAIEGNIESVQALARAQADAALQAEVIDRMTQAYIEHDKIVAQLAEAEQAHKEALDAIWKSDDASDRINETAKQLDILKKTLADNEAEIDALAGEYASLTSAIEQNTESAEDNAGAVQETGKEADAAANRLQSLNAVLSKVEGGYNLLTKAQDEMSESGYLSMDTVSELLQKYPELYGYLEQTTDGYKLTKGALDDYVASQRQEYEIALNDAQTAAQNIINAEAQKRGAIANTTASIGAQLKALAALYQSAIAVMGAANEAASKIQNGVITAGGNAGKTINVKTSTPRNALTANFQSKLDEINQALANYEAAEQNIRDFGAVTTSLGRDGKRKTSGKSTSGKSTKSKSEKAADPNKAAMDALDDWLEDMEHRIFLWSKDESKGEAIIGLYEQMQQKVHAQAEEFRSQGLSEESDEIQKLQKLWWGYADDITKAREQAEQAAAASLKKEADALDAYLQQTEHKLYLQEKNGGGSVEETISTYQAMQEKIHEMAQRYREKGLSEESEEIQALQKLWWEYADEITQARAAALDNYLKDAEHSIYLNGKNGGSYEDNIAIYQEMQERVHEMAQYYREQGYEDSSKEVQELQKLWWNYAEKITGIKNEQYSRELAALKSALEQERVTQEEYLAGMAELQSQYLTQGTEEYEAATQQRIEAQKQFRENEYSEALADIKYFLDMDIITEEDYWKRRIALRDQYLEQDSEAWRSETAAYYSYRKKQMETEQKELESHYKDIYNEQVKALKDALSEQKKLLKDKYDTEKKLAKEAYDAQKKAAKEAYDVEKKRLKAQYDADKKALKTAYEDKKKLAKDQYEAQKAAINAELEAEKNRLNAVLDSIEAEIQARKRLREDESQDDAIATARKRLEAAEAELAYARTDEDRAELRKEVAQLREELEKALQDKEDTAFYRRMEEEKERVKASLDAAAAETKIRLDSLQASYNASTQQMEAEYTARSEALETEYQTATGQLEANYKASTERMEAAYKACTEQMEADYKANTDKLEADYNANADQLQANFDATVERMKADFDATLDRLSGEYDASVQRLESEYAAKLAAMQTAPAASLPRSGSGGSPGSESGGASFDNSGFIAARSQLVRDEEGNPDYVVYRSEDGGVGLGTAVMAKKVGKDYGSGDGIGPAGSRTAPKSGSASSSAVLGGMVRSSAGGSTSYSSQSRSVSNTNNITVNVQETALSEKQITRAVERGIKKMSK